MQRGEKVLWVPTYFQTVVRISGVKEALHGTGDPFLSKGLIHLQSPVKYLPLS